MTPIPPPFTVTVECGRSSACFHLAGDLDYNVGDTVVQQARRHLVDHPGLHDLRLDCAELTFCDSVGVSSLLMIHRHAGAHSVRLHLDNRPPFLQRLLDITGLQQLFTHPHIAQQAE
ncbi:STAS domain-containing protein [Actinacidiphila paucisporea]|uniref:Anti-sigma-factor antagonist n=1 Tax=Actinacidiphila paucisporea TaxID=310782 RepID=A0A1M7MFY0_9ACTN|nr:STAS domain-containing protein [Actinacidiphila paucisporea]SHM89769.1 anti-sigma-factor antagonist [Actinacidiphila paucisporea]